MYALANYNSRHHLHYPLSDNVYLAQFYLAASLFGAGIGSLLDQKLSYPVLTVLFAVVAPCVFILWTLSQGVR
jgi:hypothetical protein